MVRRLPWIGGIQIPTAAVERADTVKGLLFGALTELLADGGLERRQVPQRVLVVDLANHFVGETSARDVPAAVARRAAGRAHLGGMLEVFVEGLEEAPVRLPEVLHAAIRAAVRSHQHAVLILDQEFAPEPRRAAEILDGR